MRGDPQKKARKKARRPCKNRRAKARRPCGASRRKVYVLQCQFFLNSLTAKGGK